MKKLLFIPLMLLFISMMPAKKKKILFFGDSITQMGVNNGGYIDRIKKASEEKGNYEFIGAGIGGNKVYDLYLRMEEDVLDKKPGMVAIYVGINDVWHKKMFGTGTDLDKFEKFYIAIIKKLQARKIKVAVCTPTVIGEKKNNANELDKNLDTFSDVIRKIAREHNCTLIDLRTAFSKYITANNPEDKESGILTTDRVHLNDKGNQLVADEMMKGLGMMN